jgi:hypothetical protein
LECKRSACVDKERPGCLNYYTSQEMRKLLNLITVGFQVTVTFVTLMILYMIFVLLDYQGGIDSFIGTILFQPILGALFSILTIVICLLVGLPIRISKRINLWWTDRFRLPVASILWFFIDDNFLTAGHDEDSKYNG